MANVFFNLSKANKMILGATKKCYVFAAENALAISKLFNDETNQIRIDMRNKAAQNLNFAQSIQEKINSDPTCDAKKIFMGNYD